jgi:aryl-alcohol dehydrogenase-like predicted oxidoreductase
MDSRNRPSSRPENLTRRELLRGGTAAAAGLAIAAATTDQVHAQEVTKTRSYNPKMEYHPLGKTGLWVSAVCMGGHWKRVNKVVPSAFNGDNFLAANLDDEAFKRNRREVVTRCIESGINHIDACTKEEVVTYAEALRGRRDSMFLAFSWYQEEMRNPDFRTAEALLGTLDKGMKEAKLDYVDLWRITMHEQSGLHTEAEVEQMMKALETARKQGKCRFTGLSSHDRPHIKWMIETYPDIVQVVVTPYTAKSKVAPTDSLFATVKQHGVGVFGIKPFSSNALFRGDSSLDNPQAQEDDRMARMAIRYILATNAITAPIPGLINTHQVDNMVKAVQEARELSAAEAMELERAMDRAWAKLPADYQWLKNWEYV